METRIYTETAQGTDLSEHLDKITERMAKSGWLKAIRFVVCYLVGVAIPFIGCEVLLRIIDG